MRAIFEFLSGDRAGQEAVVTDPYSTFGRHPLCTVAFDGESEPEISGRHAAVFREGDLFILHDLGSTNGTFVNGKRLRADHILATGDHIRFGTDGPELRVTVDASDPGRYRPAAPSPAHYSPIPPRRTKEEEPPAGSEPGAGTGTRIRAEVRRQLLGYRRVLWFLGVVAAGLLAVVVWQRFAGSRQLDAERAQLLARVDSLTGTVASMSVSMQTLQAALADGQAETERLRTRLSEHDYTPQELGELNQRLRETLDRQERMLTAAAAELGRHAETNLEAVVLVVVQFASGASYTGTGFAVHTTDDAAFVLTNKHVVLADDGGSPSRLGVVFHRSAQTFRAEVAATHDRYDLVLLRVAIAGGAPVVMGLSDRDPPVPVGSPVAILGYPLGLDLPMGGEWTEAGVSATMMTGTVTRVVPHLLQLDGYGTEGSSGSPIFDEDGLVVGVVYGGERESMGRILYAVPITAGRELLAQVLAQ